MRNWNDFDKFAPLINKYMPERGEGETLASQLCTAVNKLVYKWYNDGDVYDNTGCLDGWCNDLSSYANWLYNEFPPVTMLLSGVTECGEDEYAELLYKLASTLIKDDILLYLSERPKKGSIYECDGPFRFCEYDNDEEGY